MKPQHIILIFLLGGGVVLLQTGCQEADRTTQGSTLAPTKPPRAPKPGGPSPRITFESLVCDFGEVGPNKDNTNEIKFTNAGDALLRISKVDKCCGVVTKLDKLEYAPGEGGTLQVRWRSGPLPSVFAKQLIVRSNDPANPELSVAIRATVVQRLMVEPEQLKLFIDDENAGCPDITISSLDGQPFSIISLKSTADAITAEFDPSAQATRFVLHPKVDPEKLQKNIKGRMNIELTHPEGNLVSLVFDVLPQYTVSPGLIIIHDARPETPAVTEIKVLSNQQRDFEIESLASKGGLIGVKLIEQRKVENGYVLSAEITPVAAGGKARFSDTINITLKGGKTLPLTCYGYLSEKKEAVQKP